MSRLTRALRPLGRVLLHPFAALLRVWDAWRHYRHQLRLRKGKVTYPWQVLPPPRPDERSSIERLRRIEREAKHRPFRSRRYAR